MAKQISNLASLSKNFRAIQRSGRLVIKEAELLIYGATERRQRRQRQAWCDLSVNSVGQFDASLTPIARTAAAHCSIELTNNLKMLRIDHQMLEFKWK